MLYQLYFKARSYFVTGLVDNGWSYTLSILQTVGQLNAVYAVAVEGSLSDRVERFNKLRASEAASEADKNSFAEGLLAIDGSGQNIITKSAAALIWNPNAFKAMLAELEHISLFVGSGAEKRLLYFLVALFARDSKGRSAFLYALDNRHLDSLSFLLDKLLNHVNFAKAHQDYFFNAFTAANDFLFRRAAQNSHSYLLIRQALLKTGCTSSQLATLLNTSYPEDFFQREINCTPLMTLIYNTIRYSQRNYADFVALLLRFRADGAQLTSAQALRIRKHLEEIKDVIGIAATHVTLLNDYINMLQDIEEPAPAHHSAVAPQLKTTNTSWRLSMPPKKPVVEVFTEEDPDVLRVLNLV